MTESNDFEQACAAYWDGTPSKLSWAEINVAHPRTAQYVRRGLAAALREMHKMPVAYDDETWSPRAREHGAGARYFLEALLRQAEESEKERL